MREGKGQKEDCEGLCPNDTMPFSLLAFHLRPQKATVVEEAHALLHIKMKGDSFTVS